MWRIHISVFFFIILWKITPWNTERLFSLKCITKNKGNNAAFPNITYVLVILILRVYSF